MNIGLFSLFERFEGGADKAIKEQLELIRYADELGFDEAWIGEHHFNDFSVCPSPSMLLSYAAAITKNIRLGAAGYLAPFYDAVRLAEEVALLDNLSGGRINLGFAKGAFAPDSKHFKVAPEEMRGVMFEVVEGVDALLKDVASYKGEFVSFFCTDIEPKPIQGEIPTYIATFGSEESIRFAARHGYGLLGSQGLGLEECIAMSEIYEKEAGYKPHFTIMRTFCVADTTEEAVSLGRPAIDHFVKSMRAASSYKKSPIFDEKRYTQLVRERYEFFDGGKFFDAGIIGDEDACKRHIDYIKMKCPGAAIALKPVGTTLAQNKQMLRIFNEKIRPFI
ncbi:MAG TPA: LLM class flavin-dependent oxidoreductase [Campylobacterales bacterium]|nr:LLM class flavin-dependent oxidoreductase [Campylobacterales bacterium]